MVGMIGVIGRMDIHFAVIELYNQYRHIVPRFTNINCIITQLLCQSLRGHRLCVIMSHPVQTLLITEYIVQSVACQYNKGVLPHSHMMVSDIGSRDDKVFDLKFEVLVT